MNDSAEPVIIPENVGLRSVDLIKTGDRATDRRNFIKIEGSDKVMFGRHPEGDERSSGVNIAVNLVSKDTERDRELSRFALVIKRNNDGSLLFIKNPNSNNRIFVTPDGGDRIEFSLNLNDPYVAPQNKLRNLTVDIETRTGTELFNLAIMGVGKEGITLAHNT